MPTMPIDQHAFRCESMPQTQRMQHSNHLSNHSSSSPRPRNNSSPSSHTLSPLEKGGGNGQCTTFKKDVHIKKPDIFQERPTPKLSSPPKSFNDSDIFPKSFNPPRFHRQACDYFETETSDIHSNKSGLSGDEQPSIDRFDEITTPDLFDEDEAFFSPFQGLLQRQLCDYFDGGSQSKQEQLKEFVYVLSRSVSVETFQECNTEDEISRERPLDGVETEIYILNITDTFSLADVRDFCMQFGNVVAVQEIVHAPFRDTIAFVQYETPVGARNAKQALDGMILNEKVLVCSLISQD